MEVGLAGEYEHHIEIYSPPYLFNANGSPVPRPAISSITPNAFSYGATFKIQTPNAAGIRSVVFVRPGAVTHAIDMDQRLVGVNFTAGSGFLTVTAPASGRIAPPGYYMVFILNAAGVPSVAKFVWLREGCDAAWRISPGLRLVVAEDSIASGRVKVLYPVPRVLFLDDTDIRRTGDSEPGLRPDPRETTDGNSPPAA